MPYLARSVERIKPHYDAVVVGSGYGGAIAASRMARAGRRVCLLERGEEFQPGDYPDTPLEAAREIQMDWPDRRVGSPTGLFDFHINPDISVLVGCGLGGTSLINANVVLPPDPRVLEDPVWPEALRAEVGTRLAEGMRRAQEMLRPAPYPRHSPPLAKLTAMERSAERLGADFYRPPIAVNFSDGVNHVGVQQHACNCCGDCVSGCNIGAKNTLIMNYLPDARNHGAEIYTRTAVRRIDRRAGRWLVHYQVLGLGQERLLFLEADMVVLAAGTLGTTEILLRSRDAGLPLSDTLGQGFTGNGDVLGFAYNCDETIHGVGIGHVTDRVHPGPCISGILDQRGTSRLEDGIVVEEGVIPGALASLLPASLAAAAGILGRDTDPGARDFANERLRELNAVLFGPYSGAMCNTQTFLVMAHDDAGGRLHLQDDRLRVSWPGVGRQEIFHSIQDRLERVTAALGGTFLKNPLWAERVNNGLVTVHPLGGCRMAESAERGVVDHMGRVFAGAQGEAVHDGLYICDGSIVPRAVGVNPLLTICGLAERSCALIAEERGWNLSYELPPRPARTPQPQPQRLGLRFTETMRGHFSTAASPQGQKEDTPFEFTLTVTSDDLEAMLRSPEHPARLFGTVAAPSLSSQPLTVTDGDFQLLTVDPDRTNARRMRYRMRMFAQEGKTYFLDGFKSIRDERGPDLWSDTTTLYTTVHEGESEAGPVVGKGILHIHPGDFAKQLATIRITGTASTRGRLRAAADFGRFFAGSLYDTYGGVLARRSVLDPGAPPRKKRPLEAPAPEVFFLTAPDEARLRIVRHHAGERGPVLLVHGLGVSSAIFGIDTIETNLLEYLCGHGFDVWLLDYRTSIELGDPALPSTLDQVASLDLPAAVAKVRQETGAASTQVVAHCVGSTAFLMAMLAGMKGVRSAVCSQGSLHVRAPRTTRLKAGMLLPNVLKGLGVDTLGAYTETDGWGSRVFDAALRLAPVELEEWCTSPVCRRITSLYSYLYEHDQLNAATHDHLHEIFGATSIAVLSHLARMIRKGRAVAADGTDRYLAHPERLAIPITFLHGAENHFMVPRGSAETMNWLGSNNGWGLYRREVVPNYGHSDCIIGRDAARDVFPLIVSRLVDAAP